MKTIIKLLIALAILNAVGRGAMAAWSYYQFRDSTEELLLFGAGASTAQLHNEIIARAQQFEVPLAPENVSVQREGARTWADVAYTQPIEFFPQYTYPVDFSFTVDGLASIGVTNAP